MPRRREPRTEATLIAGGFAVLAGAGGGLLWLLYGRGVALTGLGFILGGVALFVLLWLLLRALERWARSD